MILQPHSSIGNQITGGIRAIGIYGSLFILVMMLVTTVDVVLRYIFNSPLLWAYEVAEYLLVATFYLAVAFAEAEDQHVSVQILYSRLSPMGQSIIYIITRTVILAFCILLILRTGLTAYQHMQAQETGPAAGTPMWPARLMVPIGFSLLSVQLIVGIMSRFRLFCSGGDSVKPPLQSTRNG